MAKLVEQVRELGMAVDDRVPREGWFDRFSAWFLQRVALQEYQLVKEAVLIPTVTKYLYDALCAKGNFIGGNDKLPGFEFVRESGGGVVYTISQDSEAKRREHWKIVREVHSFRSKTETLDFVWSDKISVFDFCSDLEYDMVGEGVSTDEWGPTQRWEEAVKLVEKMLSDAHERGLV